MNAQNHPRIVVDPAHCGGQPTVRGTHIAVANILRLLEDGDTEETLVADFPPLTLADVRACRAYAAATGLPATRGDWIDKVAGTLDEDFARGALEAGEFYSEADYDAAEERTVIHRGNVIRKQGKTLVELPDSVDIEPGPLSVRQVGRTIMLEPADSGPIPPGTYTFDTLPPLSDGARAIIASIDAVAPFVDVTEGAKAHDEAPGITLEDEGLDGVDLSDEGLPGLDPDN